MEKMKKFMVAAVLLSLAVGCTGCGEDSAKKEKEYNVTLITMDQMDVHWVNVNAGVEDAISELEKDGYTINYNWYAPDTKDNAKQIEQIDMAVSNRSDVILIAVNDPNACNQGLRKEQSDLYLLRRVCSPVWIVWMVSVRLWRGQDLHRVRFSILKAIRRKRRNLLQI